MNCIIEVIASIFNERYDVIILNMIKFVKIIIRHKVERKTLMHVFVRTKNNKIQLSLDTFGIESICSWVDIYDFDFSVFQRLT